MSIVIIVELQVGVTRGCRYMEYFQFGFRLLASIPGTINNHLACVSIGQIFQFINLESTRDGHHHYSIIF